MIWHHRRQAVDRAYRIGQKNDVVVYRFIVSGSVEEKMYEKQVRTLLSFPLLQNQVLVIVIVVCGFCVLICMLHVI
jgi:hypothetical protein